MSFYESTYLLLALLILSFTITPFLRKKILHEFTDEEFYVYSNAVMFALVIIYSVYLLVKNKCSLSMLKDKINTRNAMICLISGFSAVAGGLILSILLKRNDASSVIPQVQPVVIILTMMIGYFLANEDVNRYKVLGALLIVGGLVVFNRGKK